MNTELFKYARRNGATLAAAAMYANGARHVVLPGLLEHRVLSGMRDEGVVRRAVCAMRRYSGTARQAFQRAYSDVREDTTRSVEAYWEQQDAAEALDYERTVEAEWRAAKGF